MRFAREHGLLPRVRGGGHNIAGNAVCDGGLMIDLSPMQAVRVDPRPRTARVEPGATLADLDRETQAYGLATPLGINSTTGIAGLTLGGGFGWLSRKYGLTVDNLLVGRRRDRRRRAACAPARPRTPTCSGRSAAAAATSASSPRSSSSCTRSARRCSPALIVYPFDAAPGASCAGYREFAAAAPGRADRLGGAAQGAAAAVPAAGGPRHGGAWSFAVCYAGDRRRRREAPSQPLREFGTPIGDMSAPHALRRLAAGFDPLLTPGARNYWKSHNFTTLSDDAIDVAGRLRRHAADAADARSSSASSAAPPTRVPPTRRPIRTATPRSSMNVHGALGRCRPRTSACIAWARELFDADGAVRHRRRLRELPDRGRGEPRRGGLWRRTTTRLAELKAQVRPGQPVPHEPEHPGQSSGVTGADQGSV